jgi:hypothetical protein
VERYTSLQITSHSLLSPNGLSGMDTYEARATAVLRDSNDFSFYVFTQCILNALAVISIKIESIAIAIRINILDSRVPVLPLLLRSGHCAGPVGRTKVRLAVPVQN